VVITHTDSPKSCAEADDNIQLAASLALYGMLLSESKYTKKQSYKEVLDCLDKVDIKDEEVIALEKMIEQTQKLKRR
jgi:hypothetical protein